MFPSLTYLPYSETGYFSHLVTDYLRSHPDTIPFYKYAPNAAGITEAIKARQAYPVDRQVLVNVLAEQYETLKPHDNVTRNLQLLKSDNTFTVCTAHQPNLLTGYLYFIYKIIHAIKLAEELKKLHPDKDFVPVYYMGSEDNDLEELGTFRYNGNKYTWDGDGQKGAVGRMGTAGLKPLLDELFRLFGPPGPNYEQLKEMLTIAYLNHKTIGKATQCLVNELFGQYGLIVLDPDEAAFKKAIIPILKDDLLNHTANTIVTRQIEKLSVHYKAQAQPRPINIFYLNDQLRERIERHSDKWQVLGTDIQWTEAELLDELHAHPERFSPNVILRGIFQESILPDVAFIGGGAEVAYWLQLKPAFEHYKVFYPTILLRQSVQWIEPQQARLRNQLQLTIPEIFKPLIDLERDYVARHSTDNWQTNAESVAMEQILMQLKQKATALDPTLSGSSDAVLKKIKHQLTILEKKMLRAEKRKMETQLSRIARLKLAVFPNSSLQERVDNFSGFFLQYGYSFFDVLKDAMQPFRNEFLVIENNT